MLLIIILPNSTLPARALPVNPISTNAMTHSFLNKGFFIVVVFRLISFRLFLDAAKLQYYPNNHKSAIDFFLQFPILHHYTHIQKKGRIRISHRLRPCQYLKANNNLKKQTYGISIDSDAKIGSFRQLRKRKTLNIMGSFPNLRRGIPTDYISRRSSDGISMMPRRRRRRPSACMAFKTRETSRRLSPTSWASWLMRI